MDNALKAVVEGKQTAAAVGRLRDEADTVEGAIAALLAERTEWTERSR